MIAIVSRTISRLLCMPAIAPCSLAWPLRRSHWFASVLSLPTSVPLRAEPKKKKKADPRREQMVRERLKKKLKKLERVPPEFIPIEDFITPAKSLDETRVRFAPRQAFEESERRALLLKAWSRYKHQQHREETQAVSSALEAQTHALAQLRLESESLHQAAVAPDTSLLPYCSLGPTHTPPTHTDHAPDGKYNDITRVYTQ